MDKLLTDIEDAKGVFERERAKVAVTDKYWDKVQEARKHFAVSPKLDLYIKSRNPCLNDEKQFSSSFQTLNFQDVNFNVQC